ncbi:ras-related protein Rab-7b-like [Drosophila sulfurigaster albostrigata]|uniref:ras-related protein Rab-7b-like n=1 Tax=Drosophila sulfurigaster albostrigata TaxID=89887 RepID=UPI002D21E220|nr:ras-related protein Rab-7b-like [Drosophila sulfurigaster albostrigata]
MSKIPKRDFTIVIEGNPLVGKNSLRHQFINQSFPSNVGSSSVWTVNKKSFDFKAYRFELSIWVTDGKKQCRSETPDFNGYNHCCFLVFDVSNRESFEALDSWRKLCIEKIVPKGRTFPIAVIGNKIDKKIRTVSTQEAQKWCDDRLIPYFECSAQDGTA